LLLLTLAPVQDQIAALGPWGGALFVLTVMLAEMVPLFPTQPLTLASGLLFGPVKVSTNGSNSTLHLREAVCCWAHRQEAVQQRSFTQWRAAVCERMLRNRARLHHVLESNPAC
jgi:hypothetical protein